MIASRIMRLSCALVVAAGWSSSARASTAYGDLNNFDVFNDTGQECHGFEIELEDIRSTDITYTFDWNHYGTPTITEDNSVPGHPKVIIRYAAKYVSGAFTAFTAVPATTPSPTDGHMCTDISVNFGCEHFGVGHYGTPTAVRYNWLIEDPASPGSLIKGPAVSVATPNWTYYPPAGGQPAAVQAVILAPPPPPAPVYEFGDAVWVKAIVTVSHNNAPLALADLISDDPDDPNDENWAHGEPDEVEVEWHVLQTEFNNPAGANNELAGGEQEMPDGDEVITRRYEFYKYTGPLDPETNEAKCDNYPQISDPAHPEYKAECDPAAVTVLGDYIGAQMAGFNVEAALGLIDHLQDGEQNQPYTPRTVVVGGNTPYTVQVTVGALPVDLSLDSATGVLSGTPSAAGQFLFTITASDGDLVQVSRSYALVIAAPPDLCAGIICVASDACHVAGICDPATGLCSDPPAPDGTGCDDGDACTQGDACLAAMCTRGDPLTCNDDNECTHDVCEDGVCVHHPIDGCCLDDAQCADADVCTLDTCEAHVCVYDPIVGCCIMDSQCDDADSCTSDFCDLSSNRCMHAPVCCASAAECLDTDLCTLDICVSGVCEHQPVVDCCSTGADCADGNDCTMDLCVDQVCRHAPVPGCCFADADCDDTDACTVDRCIEGACMNEVIGNCCHSDAECDDGIACTVDTCSAGACVHAANDSFCSDTVTCTRDYCDATRGCMNVAEDSLCDDGFFCNGVERCHPSSGCRPANRKPCPPPFCDEAKDLCADRPLHKIARVPHDN
jgi:hypothetical protein